MPLNEQIAAAGRNIAKHIRNRGYSSIIISGSSSDISKRLLDEFMGADKPALYDFGREGNELLYKGFDWIDTMCERIPLVEEFIGLHFPGLTDNNLLYLDDHAKRGCKINCLRDNFPQFGFKKVEFAVIAAGSNLMGENFYAGIYSDKLVDYFKFRLDKRIPASEL
jgi:hypothetical protein